MALKKTVNIYYLLEDYNLPSWGMGLIYGHVRLLRRLGYDAFVLHRRPPFCISWLDEPAVPIVYLESKEFQLSSTDVLIVPDVMAHCLPDLGLQGRKLVFVQGSYFMLANFPTAVSYTELGFEKAITILPHIAGIIQAHFGIDAHVIPPYIAPYFFKKGGKSRPFRRKKRILLAGKPEYRQAGYHDYDIFCKILNRYLPANWELMELRGLKHAQVAELMATSAFLVNLNTLEAFNTTVPEAMAAGCVVLCYEACGGQDFLLPGKNAFVFPNNHVFPLIEKMRDMIDNFEQQHRQREDMQKAARATAHGYTEAGTSDRLGEFYTHLLNTDPQHPNFPPNRAG